MNAWRGVIEHYRKYLPVTDKTPVVSLCEGNTPLIHAYNLEKIVGGGLEIWLKNEGLNPTASFKDRGMTVAVSLAVERGAKAVICASTGNTSASAASYAARAGIKCVVLLPKGAIAMGKLTQAMMEGATVIALRGNFDDALRIVREIGERSNIQIVNSINPDRIEGQKTAAFEVCDALGRAPDFHLLPVGNAGQSQFGLRQRNGDRAGRGRRGGQHSAHGPPAAVFQDFHPHRQFQLVPPLAVECQQ